MTATDGFTGITGVAAVAAIVPVHDDVAHVPALLTRLEPLLAAGGQVVLVDDASTDGTGALLADWAAGRDEVVLVRLEANEGVAAARNRALDLVRRPLVWFGDSDDHWHPDLLATLTAALGRADADVAVVGAVIEEGEGRRTVEATDAERVLDGGGAARAMLAGALHGYLWNKLFRLDAIGGTRFPPLRSQSDFPFVFTVLGGARRTVHVPGALYTHVLRAGSLSQARVSGAANLAACLAVVEADPVVARLGLARELRAFRAWFYVSAAARSIARSSVSPAERLAELEPLRAEVDLRVVPGLWRRHRSAAVRLVLLRLVPGLLPMLQGSGPGPARPRVLSDIGYGALVDARDPSVFRGGRRSALLTTLAMCVRARRYDLVLTNEGNRTPLGLVLLAAFLAATGRRSLVVTEFLPGVRGGLRGRLVTAGYRLVLGRAVAAVQVMTPWEKDDYTRRFRLPPERVHLVPFYALDEREGAAPVPLAERERRVFTSGRNSFDVATVVAAAADIAAPVDLVCTAATAASLPGDLPANLRVRTDLPRAQHDDELARAAVFLLVTAETRRSAGHVRLMTSATVGTPVVATDVAGIQGYEHLAVASVPPGDAPALAAAVNRLLDEPERTERLAADVRRHAAGWTRADYLRAIEALVRGAAGVSAPSR